VHTAARDARWNAIRRGARGAEQSIRSMNPTGALVGAARTRGRAVHGLTPSGTATLEHPVTRVRSRASALNA
jgi:hypothetical protein